MFQTQDGGQDGGGYYSITGTLSLTIFQTQDGGQDGGGLFTNEQESGVRGGEEVRSDMMKRSHV